MSDCFKTKNYIEKAIQKHGDKYDYSLVEYINSASKIKIKCVIHGIFEQRANDHLNGRGCFSCHKDNRGGKTFEQFKEEANHKHNNKYDYSKTEFKNLSIKITIICPIHGIFQQRPLDHLKGCGCSNCAKINKVNVPTKTNKKFIEDAKKRHGDKYDYSHVNYINCETKVIIICPVHGIFKQIAKDHIRGSGCSKCSLLTKKSLAKTQKQFIEDAVKIHGDLYDYSLVKYTNCHSKIIIICKIHSNYEQRPNDHLQGKGCSKCAHEKTALKQTKTTEQFIKEAKEIHGNKYEYFLVEYINSWTKVLIVCPDHDEFEQLPTDHLDGHGCPKCTIHHKKSNEEFIESAKLIHNDNYDYSLTDYYNNITLVKIICKIHGIFEQKPFVHLNGSGCQKCAIEISGSKQLKSTEKFIEEVKKIHNNLYDYSLTNYTGAHNKIIIICKIHGNFLQKANDHLNGSGCLKCKFRGISKQQIKWLEYISFKENLYIRHGMNEGELILPETNYRVDGYCKETNTCYEYNGCYFHGCIKCYKPNEINKLSKKLMCELYHQTFLKKKVILEKGYNLITIWEHEWLLIVESVKKIQRWWRLIKKI